MLKLRKILERLRCQYDFWRLSPKYRKIFREVGQDPKSRIKRGEL